MENIKSKQYDKILALAFGVLTLVFLILAFTNESFFNWAYERHQNQLSWYIRPLFLIPFCYFAYKRRWAGIVGTVFFLLTSMFWFPKPDLVSEQVKQFLEMEKEWLSGNWGLAKILMSLLPVDLAIVAVGNVQELVHQDKKAFWQRYNDLPEGFLLV